MADYDGTLAPFRLSRDAAFPYAGIPALLARIMRQERVQLALVTGRRAYDLAAILGPQVQPEIWGCHGLERLMPNGSYTAKPLDGRALIALAQIDARLKKEGLKELLEHKLGSIAVHWRGLPQATIAELREKLVVSCLPICSNGSLVTLQFDGGLEFRVTGTDKGSVVRALLAEASADCTAAYLGDDITDEYAFQALRGRGLRVLVRPTPRTTSADLWVRPPEGVIEFLEEWFDACGGAS